MHQMCLPFPWVVKTWLIAQLLITIWDLILMNQLSIILSWTLSFWPVAYQLDYIYTKLIELSIYARIDGWMDGWQLTFGSFPLTCLWYFIFAWSMLSILESILATQPLSPNLRDEFRSLLGFCLILPVSIWSAFFFTVIGHRN